MTELALKEWHEHFDTCLQCMQSQYANVQYCQEGLELYHKAASEMFSQTKEK